MNKYKRKTAKNKGEKMMQEKVTELGSQAILLPENEFHSFRLQFNSLFIKEELNTAHNLALKTRSS